MRELKINSFFLMILIVVGNVRGAEEKQNLTEYERSTPIKKIFFIGGCLTTALLYMHYYPQLLSYCQNNYNDDLLLKSLILTTCSSLYGGSFMLWPTYKMHKITVDQSTLNSKKNNIKSNIWILLLCYGLVGFAKDFHFSKYSKDENTLKLANLSYLLGFFIAECQVLEQEKMKFQSQLKEEPEVNEVLIKKRSEFLLTLRIERIIEILKDNGDIEESLKDDNLFLTALIQYIVTNKLRIPYDLTEKDKSCINQICDMKSLNNLLITIYIEKIGKIYPEQLNNDSDAEAFIFYILEK